jgi:pyruvate dehydrogenase (quinone)
MAKKRVADLLVDVLAEAGVRHIYGVSGDSLNGITDSIRARKQFRWIHVRHEETAAFAAGAEAHLTGRLAVCAGSCGPGNLHLINGLYDCHRSRVPVLAIAAQIPSNEIGSGYFQETHPEHLFAQCSHYCELVSHPEQMPRVLEIAMQTALARRGVAVVTLPGDVGLREAIEQGPRLHFAEPRPTVRPSDDEITGLARVLNDSKKTTILAGAGCAGAHQELIPLAGTLKAPIVHAMRGKEFVECDNPFDVGMTGLLGFSSGYHAMMNCDTLLMLGTDFPYQQFYPKHATIVQVDLRGEQIGRRTKVDLGLVGDVKTTLVALSPKLHTKNEGTHLSESLELPRGPQEPRRFGDGRARTKADPSAICSEDARRACHRGRDFFLRCGHSDDLGGPVPDDERQTTAPGLLHAWLHGECAPASHWGAGQSSGPAGDRLVRGRRDRDAHGRSALASAVALAGQDDRAQQRLAGLCRAGNEGGRPP